MNLQHKVEASKLKGKESCPKLPTIVCPRLTKIEDRAEFSLVTKYLMAQWLFGYILTVQSGGQSGGGKGRLPKTGNFYPKGCLAKVKQGLKYIHL